MNRKHSPHAERKNTSDNRNDNDHPNDVKIWAHGVKAQCVQKIIHRFHSPIQMLFISLPRS